MLFFFSPIFNFFPQEFQAHKKQGTGLLGRVTDSLHNISASYMMKNRSPEFIIMYDYIHALSEKLGVVDRISQRVSKEQAGTNLSQFLFRFHFSYVQSLRQVGLKTLHFSLSICLHSFELIILKNIFMGICLFCMQVSMVIECQHP